jgi:homoaconitate hydratase
MLPRSPLLKRSLRLSKPSASASARLLATHTSLPSSDLPQSFIEKIVQKYAVDLNPGQKVQAGDYLSVRPQQVMTHDNTGPCISKVSFFRIPALCMSYV